MFKVWQLRWSLWKIQRAFAKDHQKLVKEKASREEFEKLDAAEYFEVRDVEREIDCQIGRHLFDVARSLDVEIPSRSDSEMWTTRDDDMRVWLSSKGRAKVRKSVDEEKARRFEVKTQWVTRLILPLLGLLIGVLGAITGLIAVLHQKK
jgi:hypothetical protein